MRRRPGLPRDLPEEQGSNIRHLLPHPVTKHDTNIGVKHIIDMMSCRAYVLLSNIATTEFVEQCYWSTCAAHAWSCCKMVVVVSAK